MTDVAIRRQPPVAVQELADESILALITEGDTAKLSVPQKLAYYKARCDISGLDYRTAPMQFIKLQGKETLYTLKSGADQLASKHGIRCEILSQVTEDDIRTVTVRATCADGRQTDEIGSVSVGGLKGEARANAYMKCATKAKRRAILSVTGHGTLDETETESIPGAVKPTSDLPWAQRASAVEGTKDEDLEATLAASLEAPRDAAPVVAVHYLSVTSLPDASDVVPEEGAAPPFDETFQPYTEAVLINEKDRRWFHACRTEGKHSPEEAKSWLEATRGITSTSEIHKDWLKEICDRLRDPKPLYREGEL